jgi:hypothetical protein
LVLGRFFCLGHHHQQSTFSTYLVPFECATSYLFYAGNTKP